MRFGDVPAIDFVVILLFLTVIIGIGAKASKNKKTARDFTTAGQKLYSSLCTGSCIASAMEGHLCMSKGKYEVILEAGMGIVASWFWWIGWLFLLHFWRSSCVRLEIFHSKLSADEVWRKNEKNWCGMRSYFHNIAHGGTISGGWKCSGSSGDMWT